MLLPLKAVISKKARKDGKSLIYFQYCFSSTHRVLLNTEIAIPKAFWNTKRQCISKLLPIETGDSDQLNADLGKVKKTIEAIIEQGISINEPNIGAYVKTMFKPGLDISTLPQKPVAVSKKAKEPDFFTEMEIYIKSKEKQVCEKGLANFVTTKVRLQAFQTFRGKPITFKELDYNFYLELLEFLTYDYSLQNRKTPEFGLRISSIGKNIKQLRMFVKDRVRRKIIAPIDMEDFKIVDEETDAVYLSYEEIGKIYNVDLSQDKTLAFYRDMFVLGCLTGLRFSDYSTLHWSDLRNGLLFKKTNKMDSWVVIPLRKEAEEIFKRHYIQDVPKIRNAAFNTAIKDIAALAGISQSITFTYKKGNKDISVTRPKSHWVTSHTCRRSFCTNEYLAGTEVSLIMKISGHKTHKEFFKYIRVTQEEAARKIQEIWVARNNMATFSMTKTA